MPLSEEQLLLIHAGIDEETSVAEAAALELLLQASAEARAEHADITRVRALVSAWGVVRAPDSLRMRVLEAIRPAPVLQLPARGWRHALLAAAAVVVIGLGLMIAAAPTPEIEAPPTTAAITEITKRPEVTPAAVIDDNLPAPNDTVTRGKLNLDRGLSAPLEVTINFSREGTDVLRAYHDLLAVSREFGDAALTGHEAGRWDDRVAAGTDFTVADAVLVDVVEADLPALLSAIDRAASSGGFGRLIVPGDLLAAVTSVDAAASMDSTPKPPADRSPLRVTGRNHTETKGASGNQRKIKVAIRLR